MVAVKGGASPAALIGASSVILGTIVAPPRTNGPACNRALPPGATHCRRFLYAALLQQHSTLR